MIILLKGFPITCIRSRVSVQGRFQAPALLQFAQLIEVLHFQIVPQACPHPGGKLQPVDRFAGDGLLPFENSMERLNRQAGAIGQFPLPHPQRFHHLLECLTEGNGKVRLKLIFFDCRQHGCLPPRCMCIISMISISVFCPIRHELTRFRFA